MKNEDLEPLLRDLSTDSDFASFRGNLKMRARIAVQNRRRIRQMLRVGGGLLALSLISLLMIRRPIEHARPLQKGSQLQVKRATPSPPGTVRPTNDVVIISDQELVASFPPGSCELVEVNGQMRLVFLDAALGEKVMR